ncbi:MAG: RdgB/HAM1 family non-canonical purine NTP pyrophosphatase [Alphaproteobacteria bacterium]|nr:RdgB/HAM1 family non-canonical purine NTP pyrophosphatase [Alphaproteobacteria bacterium]
MTTRWAGERLVIASHNAGKVREIGDLLAPFGVEVVSAAALGLAEPDETGLTFADNARLKAHAAATASGLPALADDSGLAVNALGGRPGIHSARVAGPERDFAMAMRTIEDELAGQSDRSARFVCALTLAWPDGREVTVEGLVEGDLVWPPRGTRGFGYDPVFVAKGDSRTFAEIDPAEKHAISHRADAFKKLVAACFA